VDLSDRTKLLDSLWMILYIGLLIFGYRDIGVHIIRYRSCWIKCQNS